MDRSGACLWCDLGICESGDCQIRCRRGLALVSDEDGEVWPKVCRFFPFAAIERQLQQPLIVVPDAEKAFDLLGQTVEMFDQAGSGAVRRSVRL